MSTPPTIADLRSRLPALMRRDARRLQRRLERARDTDLGAIAAIATEVDDAERRVGRRQESVPQPRYPAELPITERKDELVEAIRENQVVIVAGETGSGKSTQLPKMCLDAGLGVKGLVGHTQPRRLAARAVAERVAEELGTGLGDLVGYTVRFTDTVSDRTLVKVMTDGILLAEIQRDRYLNQYDMLIIDEAHERSLNIDFILGYLKQLLPRRRDLKVIITSATIDTERFSRHFDSAPVVEVSGRAFPVEVRYEPVVDERDDAGRDQTQAICDAIEELAGEGPGDVLVFLSGEREIRDTAEAVSGLRLPDLEVLPLYARLSAAEQHRVFAPHKGRRIVLATNVAETSLTVPGIRYVVDPGTARISRYSRRTKVQRLPIEPVSQASANQRAGRCGRVAPGVCIRLYAEDDFASRPEFTEPEILRTHLASVILQMAALGLGDVASFPFVDAPDPRSIKDGTAVLEELGALDPSRAGTNRWLTPVGRRLAQLPLDPRLARMVLAAADGGCVREVMVIAAGLAIQDPRERPLETRKAADEAHARFADADSDFVALLNLWTYLREQQKDLSSSQFRKLCRAEHLNYLRVREWQDIYSQLRQVGGALGIHLNAEPGDRDSIHVALLAGLLSHIGARPDDRHEYQGAYGARFAIAPGSGLFQKPPRWVMAAELVETSRLWARVAGRIRPEWAERAGSHLVKRSYSDPWWESGRGAAMANERVTLYGLTLVAARPVTYGRVDPDEARAMFIHHALVEGDWRTHHAFVPRNQAAIDEVRALEDRARRRDILVDDEQLFRFYDRRVGSEVTSARHFDSWWKKERERRPDLLDLTADVLVRPDARAVSATDYPSEWRQGELTLPLSYEFDPTSATDGVTVHIPLAVLNRVTPDGFDWHVPGFRHELVTELIRTMPKALRRNFVPAPDYARDFLERAGPDDGRLLDTLARQLARMTGERVPPGSFDVERLPPHLRVTFSAEDAAGRTLGQANDLDALKRRLHPEMRESLGESARAIERSGLRRWTIGALPRVVESTLGDHAVRGYPALVDEGDAVGVRVLPNPASQERAMWAGTRRLLFLEVPGTVAALQRRLSNHTKLALASAPHSTVADVIDDSVGAAIDKLLLEHGGPAWDEHGFDELSRAVKARLVDVAVDVTTAAAGVLGAARRIEERVGRLTAPPMLDAVGDIRVQLARLTHPGFATAAGTSRLPDLFRYLEAIERRVDKLSSDARRDGEKMRRAQRLQDDLDQLLDRLPPGPAAEEAWQIRWMIEELRVSYWAQSLGTAVPVSDARIAKEIDRLSPA